MKIEVTMDTGPLSGQTFTCTCPHEGARYVDVAEGATCPVCATYLALMDKKGVVRALTSPDRLVIAQEETRAKFGTCRVLKPEGPFKVRARDRHEDDRGATGAAECARCGSHVGTLRVAFDTLYGAEEDKAMLEGRARVY